jgi:O-methyltransferase involved in polyketide biosynthesis
MSKIDTSGLTDAQATLLMPLWARAVESRSATPLLHDARAEEIVDRLDFDFDEFRRRSVPSVDYCLRASVIDQLVQRFLNGHEQATVVEIGVGLDTRFDRLNRGNAVWMELDLPDAMQIRRLFFEPVDRRFMISGSLLESDWLDEVEQHRQGPILFVAEGVLYFFDEPQIREVISRLADRFPGAGVVFDAQSPLFLWFSNRRHPMQDSRLRFSLADVRKIESWDERLRIRDYIGFGDSPYYDAGMSRVSGLRRWARRLCPPIRHMFKIVHVGW